MKYVHCLLLVIGTIQASWVFAQTFTFDSFPNGVLSSVVEFEKSIWLSFDVNGGIVEFNTETTKSHIRMKGIEGRLNGTITGLCVAENDLFATTKFHGIYRYRSDQKRWINITPPEITKDSNFFASDSNNDTLMVGGAQGCLFWTDNSGKNWQKIQLPGNPDVNCLKYIGTSWLVGSDNKKMFRISSDLSKVYPVSVSRAPEGFYTFWDIEKLGDTIITTNSGDCIYVSTNDGISWNRLYSLDSLRFSSRILVDEKNNRAMFYLAGFGLYQLERLSGSEYIKAIRVNDLVAPIVYRGDHLGFHITVTDRNTTTVYYEAQ